MQQLPNIGAHVPTSYYGGIRVFTWLSDLVGLPVDLVNFLLCQFVALLLASLFRTYLHPSKVSVELRHGFGLALGLFCGYFCFGQQAIHIAMLPAICYILIRTQSPQIVQKLVLAVALAYLSCIHFHRQYYDYGSYSLDITGPLMIITQKVTSLAFSIHDGFRRTVEGTELTNTQQYHAISRRPSALEFFSYTLHFQSLMAGPLVFYRDYMEFIDGSQYKMTSSTSQTVVRGPKAIPIEPSPMRTVINKVVASCTCAFIFLKFSTLYPIHELKEESFVEGTGFAYKFWFIVMATTCIRFKYYHAWLLADAICNNSGLGFNGYNEETGAAKWDKISNINVIHFEFATNFRDCINNWNMGTNRWLRNLVYERVPKKYGTMLTFSLSAVWHGFYPGYYVTFASGALIVTAARVARNRFRHHFQKTANARNLYDALTCLVTRLFMGYATFPFVLLEFQASLRLYLKLYMCLHVIAFATIYLLPRVMRGEKRSSSTSPQPVDASAEDKASLGNNGIGPQRMLSNGTRHRLVAGSNGRRVEEETIFNDIKKNLENFDSKNIEDLLQKTRMGISELRELMMKESTPYDFHGSNGGLEEENCGSSGSGTVDGFLKKEIHALNAASNVVLPAVLSNGHAK